MKKKKTRKTVHNARVLAQLKKRKLDHFFNKGSAIISHDR